MFFRHGSNFPSLFGSQSNIYFNFYNIKLYRLQGIIKINTKNKRTHENLKRLSTSIQSHVADVELRRVSPNQQGWGKEIALTIHFIRCNKQLQYPLFFHFVIACPWIRIFVQVICSPYWSFLGHWCSTYPTTFESFVWNEYL